MTVPNPDSGPFADLERYVALPRMAGLTMSPDGTSLAVSVSRPSPAGTAYRSSVWFVDPAGVRPARRLTRGAEGQSAATWTRDGDLLFTAERPDPDATDPQDPGSAVWRLPAGGGEAELVAARTAGFSRVLAARAGTTLVLGSTLLPGAADPAADDELRGARREAKVDAILHAGYPVRYWDHDLGPDQQHLLVADPPVGQSDNGPVEPAEPAAARVSLRTVTPDAGAALTEAGVDLSADGARLVCTWNRPTGRGAQRSELVTTDVATGERETLAADPRADLRGPKFSPDGTRVAYLREEQSTPQRAPRITLEVIDVAGRAVRALTADWDRWPSGITWRPDGTGLLVTADQDGRTPIFAVDLTSGAIDQLTTDDAAFTDVWIAPDGETGYALRTSYLAPSHPVRIALSGPDRGKVDELPAPVPAPALPGSLVEVDTRVAAGAPGGDDLKIRGWLALPVDAGPDNRAPLLLWIHGGPLGSWNAWSWRWNPWVMVAAGYAVLLPDPALSTGYGQDFVQRGWAGWGAAPYTDLMALTDEVVARPDIDADRTAAMGGSFGGYMANWVAGQTDRFAAIVTHASLWALEDFGGTTDAAYYWGREMSPEMARDNSPHHHLASIVTPMLVIHGDKDYRVPIGQGIRLYYDLLSGSGRPADENGDSPHRLLYFPGENHWVLTPQHAKLWYRVVLDFLAEHVLGAPPAPLPTLLGGPALEKAVPPEAGTGREPGGGTDLRAGTGSN